jgi:hypothetical protein
MQTWSTSERGRVLTPGEVEVGSIGSRGKEGAEEDRLGEEIVFVQREDDHLDKTCQWRSSACI